MLFILFIVLIVAAFWINSSPVHAPTTAAAHIQQGSVVCDTAAGETGPHCAPFIVRSISSPASDVTYSTPAHKMAGTVHYQATPPKAPTVTVRAAAAPSAIPTVQTATPSNGCSAMERDLLQQRPVKASETHTWPPDFFLEDYSPDQMSCNDIMYADHCMYPGRYAFLRTVDDRYESLPTKGVYGGRYCAARCEPRPDAGGPTRGCVCVCTKAPTPKLS